MKVNNTAYVEVEREGLHREIFKNDFIRIYRAEIAPGEGTVYHRHSRNTLYIAMQGGKISTENMKGSSSCPVILPQGLSIIKKLSLLREKIFSRYLTLTKGFIFYMPSEGNPVVHRALCSDTNLNAMDMLGVEFLHQNHGLSGKSPCYGKKELENNAVAVSRLVLPHGKKASGLKIEGKTLLLILAGKIEIGFGRKSVHVQERDFYWFSTASIREIRNTGSHDTELLFIHLKGCHSQ